MTTQNKTHRQAGFTLIEILITIVILSIGLLGIAGMQAAGLRNNHAAYTKTQAANLAMDMADRMRANPNGIDNYAGLDTNIGGTIPEDPGCINSAGGCTPAEVAAYDKYEWSIPILGKSSVVTTSTKPALPQGRGIISRNGDEFSVTLLWREPAYQGMTPNKCDGFEDESDEIACFQMRFIP